MKVLEYFPDLILSRHPERSKSSVLGRHCLRRTNKFLSVLEVKKIKKIIILLAIILNSRHYFYAKI